MIDFCAASLSWEGESSERTINYLTAAHEHGTLYIYFGGDGIFYHFVDSSNVEKVPD